MKILGYESMEKPTTLCVPQLEGGYVDTKQVYSVHPTIVCVTQWKGGVAKTTTADCFAAALVLFHGKRVLIVDNDPQANTTIALLPTETVVDKDVCSLYYKGELQDAVYPSVVPGLDIVPSSIDLSIVEMRIISEIGREQLLKDALDCDFAKKYDYIIIDTSPLLGSIVINSLNAANKLLIPVSDYFSLEGISKFLNVIFEIKKKINKDLEIGGVVLTLFNERTVINKNIRDEVKNVFKDLVLETSIPENVKLKEAPSYKQSIFTYAPSSTGAGAYKKLTKEIVSKWEV